MGGKDKFRFKQFFLYQDQCAMKIGTDGVLLGSWISIDHVKNALDVGAGTGLLACMLAQRSKQMNIDALEIEQDAFIQCKRNISSSPFSQRINVYHGNFLSWDTPSKYDLIISNLPFYRGEKYEDNKRYLARSISVLPWVEFLSKSKYLLTIDGSVGVILPFCEKNVFLSSAKELGFFTQKITLVKGTPTSKIKRCLISLSLIEKDFSQDELIIEYARHEYSERFKNLTSEFYLSI